MITAELANSYNKDVFAVPGKISDSKSTGCNYLIKNNKAILFTDAAELIQTMNWDDKAKSGKEKRSQRELFIEMTTDEKIVVAILQEKEKVHIDEINEKSGLSSSAVAAGILNLELQSVILSLPGKLYQLA
jgi:DNA processing protein